MTVADRLRHCLATHWRPKAKPSTAKNFEGMIKRTLIPEFGSKRLSELTRAQVRAWHAKRPIGPDKPISTWRSCTKRLSLPLATG